MSVGFWNEVGRMRLFFRSICEWPLLMESMQLLLTDSSFIFTLQEFAKELANLSDAVCRLHEVEQESRSNSILRLLRKPRHRQGSAARPSLKRSKTTLRHRISENLWPLSSPFSESDFLQVPLSRGCRRGNRQSSRKCDHTHLILC